MAVTADYTRPTVAAAPVAAEVSTRWRPLLVGIVAAELLLLFAPTARFLYERWTMSVWHNAHGMFVPPLVALLAWQELKTRKELPVRGSAWGFALLVPALLLHALDAGIHSELLSAIALFIKLRGH